MSIFLLRSLPAVDEYSFSGYNPPRFVIDAAQSALERVDCNQYAPTKVWPIDH